MKALGTTLFAIVLTMSPVAIVNAQTAAQPTTASEAITKSDFQNGLRSVQGKLSKQMAAAETRRVERDKQAETQRKADEEEASIRLSRQLALQAQAQRKADHNEQIHLFKMFVAIAGGVLVIIVIAFTAQRGRKTENPTAAAAPKKSRTPGDLYGQYPGSDQVRKCLRDNKLKAGLFTIDLPADGVVFEYRAVVMPDGNVMAYFTGNEKPVSLEPQKLRKIAKTLWNQGKLEALELKPTGIRSVS